MKKLSVLFVNQSNWANKQTNYRITLENFYVLDFTPLITAKLT